jgi:hypothetical protein
MQKANLVFCGVALMIYPYFCDTVGLTLVIGAVLSIVPFMLRWW